jgi:acyl carrier protein
MQVENRVRAIVCYQLDIVPEQVRMETSFAEDLKVDSLTTMELTLALEEAFDIDILENDVGDVRTFRDTVECIAAKLEANRI